MKLFKFKKNKKEYGYITTQETISYYENGELIKLSQGGNEIIFDRVVWLNMLMNSNLTEEDKKDIEMWNLYGVLPLNNSTDQTEGE